MFLDANRRLVVGEKRHEPTAGKAPDNQQKRQCAIDMAWVYLYAGTLSLASVRDGKSRSQEQLRSGGSASTKQDNGLTYLLYGSEAVPGITINPFVEQSHHPSPNKEQRQQYQQCHLEIDER